MLRSFLTIGLLQLATMLVLFVRTKTLALLLGPEYVGAMAVTDKLLAVMAQTASLSFPFAALRFLPEAWEKGHETYRALLQRMLAILVTATVLVSAAAIGITLTAPQTWGRDLLPYRSVILSAAFTVPVLMLVPFTQSAIAGRMQEGKSMRFALANAGALAASAIVGAKWRGLVGMYAMYSVLGLIAVIWGLRAAFAGTKSDGAKQARPAGQSGVLGLSAPVWRFSGGLLVLTFIAPYAALRVHYSVLSRLGAESAGWLQAAMGLALSVRALLGSAHSVFLTPNVNRGGGIEARLAWANDFQRTFCLLAILLTPALLLFTSLAVDILYSPSFSPGAHVAFLFILAEVVTLISGTYQALILAFDHIPFHVVQNVMAQLLLAGVALFLIPRIGIAGAGAGALAAPTFLYITTLYFLRRRHGVRLPPHVRNLGIFTVIGLLACGVVGARWPELTVTTILLKGCVYVATLGFALFLVQPEDRRRLRSLLALRGRTSARSPA